MIRDSPRSAAKLALRAGGCGLRTHDLKELQRLYVSSALLVAPAVFAATGERIGSAAVDAEGPCYENQLQSSIQDIVAYGGTAPDFNNGGPVNAKIWAHSISLKFNKHLLERIDHLHRMKPLAESKIARARLKSCSGVGAQWLAAWECASRRFQTSCAHRTGPARCCRRASRCR